MVIHEEQMVQRGVLCVDGLTQILVSKQDTTYHLSGPGDKVHPPIFRYYVLILTLNEDDYEKEERMRQFLLQKRYKERQVYFNVDNITTMEHTGFTIISTRPKGPYNNERRMLTM